MNRRSTMTLGTALGILAGASFAAERAMAQDKIPTLLITGHNNHNWRFTSRVHEETLEATGRFDVEITEDPAAVLSDPTVVARYRLFVLDYNDLHEPKRWGAAAEANFASAVREGAGVVALHSANNAFAGWEDYERMLGLVWREGAGHGKFHAFDVEPFEDAHEIMSGLGTFRTTDELYHGLSNPTSTTFTLLAHAMSTRDSDGTGQHEPVAITTEFGEGCVFSTTLGHVWDKAPATKRSVLVGAFRSLVARGAEWAATGAVTLPARWDDRREHNTLTDTEMAEGWILLFDGIDARFFRGFKKDALPDVGWTITHGTLHRPAGQGGGDIITRDQFGDFELVLDWRASERGNSGVIYRCTEEFKWAWETGLEMQILDDERHRDGKNPKTSAGSLYDLFPAAHDVVRPAGEWNTARIVARGTKIEHWLNGVKIVDVDLAGPEYAAAHAASKWPTMPNMGTRPRGHIALQDHGDEVWFRNIKIRELK